MTSVTGVDALAVSGRILAPCKGRSAALINVSRERGRGAGRPVCLSSNVVVIGLYRLYSIIKVVLVLIFTGTALSTRLDAGQKMIL